MKTLTAAAVVALTAGLAAAATHTSTIQIDRGRATVSNFTGAGPLAVNLNMATDTLTPASGTYSLDIPAAGTVWQVFASGSIDIDFDGDNVFETSLVVDNVLVDSSWTSPGFFTSWTGSYILPIADFEFDTTPYGGSGSILFTGVSATITGVDLDNPAASGALGDNAYVDLTIDAATGLDEVKMLLTAADMLGNGDGILNFRFNTDMAFTLVPAPGAAGVLAFGGLVAARRRR